VISAARKRWKIAQWQAIALGVSAIAAVFVGGNVDLRNALLLVGLVALGAAVIAVPLLLGQRRRFNAAAVGVLLLSRASFDVDGIRNSPSLQSAVAAAKLSTIRSLARNRIGGWVTVTNEELSFEPDWLTRRWRVTAFNIEMAAILRAEVGHIGLTGAVELELSDGATIELRGSTPGRWRDVLAGTGVVEA
jgi:hypothetical protein